MASFFPRLFPAGADARPKPLAVITSTSMVSSPRLLKIFLAMRSSMIDDKLVFPLLVRYTLCYRLILGFGGLCLRKLGLFRCFLVFLGVACWRLYFSSTVLWIGWTAMRFFSIPPPYLK